MAKLLNKQMKRYITIALVLMANQLNAQCVPTCQSMTQVSGNVINTAYNGSKCFYSANQCIINNSVNFNNFEYLAFYGNFHIKQTINVNNGKSLYLTGDIQADNITLAGNANLYVDGYIIISNIISNNGWSNSLYTTSTFDYKGITYDLGDTIYTANGSGNYVVVKSCNSAPLFNQELVLVYDNNKLTWSSGKLQYSSDSKTWSNTYYNIAYNNPKNGYYRLELDGIYSKIVRVNASNKEVMYRLDVMGNKTNKTNEPHFEVYDDGEVKKVLILK